MTRCPDVALVAEVARTVGLEPESVRFLGGGVASLAWEIRTTPDPAVIRWMAPNSSRRCAYGVEHELLVRLRSLGLPVPEPLGSRLEGADGNWSVTSRVAGEPLGAGELSSRCACDLGSVLAVLHAVPTTRFGPLDVVGEAVGGSHASHDSGMQARWISADIWPFGSVPLPGAFLEDLHRGLSFRLEALGASVRASATGRSPVLNHSDLHREHVFIESERLTGIIDFGGAFVGSPAWEFAAIALFLGWGSATTARAAYVANGGVDVSLDEVALLAAAFGAYRLRVEHQLGNGATVGVDVLRFLLETLERIA